jgi:hypothetical protein
MCVSDMFPFKHFEFVGFVIDNSQLTDEELQRVHLPLLLHFMTSRLKVSNDYIQLEDAYLPNIVLYPRI